MAASEWVPFAGNVEDNGSTYILRNDDGTGEVVIDKMHVDFAPERVDVRVGANATVRKVPSGSRPSNAVQLMNDPCEGKGTFCIGSVEFCCHNGKVIGPCDGQWGCE